MSRRNTASWPFPEAEPPSLDSFDDECRESTTAAANTAEIARPDYRTRALVGRTPSPSQIPQPKSSDDQPPPKLSTRSYVGKGAAMSPISEDSSVAVPETTPAAMGKGLAEASPEGSVYHTVDGSDDGAASAGSEYPSVHDVAHIWADEDDLSGTRATTLGASRPASADGPSARSSLAVGSTSAVDLSSGTSVTAPTMTIRRGPRIRHDRLLRSETMPSTQRAVFGPDEEALTADQLRAQDRRSHVYILLSAILTSGSVTLLVNCSVVLSLFEKHIVEDNEDLVTDKGALIACIAIGAIGTIVGLTLVCLAYFKHAGHRNNAAQDDGNAWIEMNHRNKPLPRVPGLLAENPNPKEGWNDPKVNSAWDKLYNDKDGLRTYVEALEMRCVRLAAAQDGGSGEANARPTTERPPVPPRDNIAEATTTGRASRAINNGRFGHRTNVPSPLVQVSNNRDSTTSAADENVDKSKVSIRDRNSIYKHAAKGSISGLALIRSSSDAETVLDDPADADFDHGLRRSDSQDSILTVLCNGVIQPYSPLGEHHHRDSTISTVAETQAATTTTFESQGRRSISFFAGRTHPQLRRFSLIPDEDSTFPQFIKADKKEDHSDAAGKGKGRAD